MFGAKTSLGRLMTIRKHLMRFNLARSFSTKPMLRTFKTGVWVIPHIEKRYKGGEDANAVTDTMI